jgi:CrcB protein
VDIVLIGLGGGLGAMLRYGVARLAQPLGGASFPAGTLVVNLSGAFVLGFLATYLVERTSMPVEWRLGVTVGVLGGYTTFSTFSLETLNLLSDDQWLLACVNAAVSVVACVFLAWAGQTVARL